VFNLGAMGEAKMLNREIGF